MKELSPSIVGFETWTEFDMTNVDEIPSFVVEQQLTQSAPVGNKLEKKLSLTLGGYQARHGVLVNKVNEVTGAIEQARIDLEVYKALQAGEQVTGPLRVASLLEEVEILERRERDGQRRYKELDVVKKELLQTMSVNGH
jgi:pre-mRNA-splicing factor CDC5/CEF1